MMTKIKYTVFDVAKSELIDLDGNSVGEVRFLGTPDKSDFENKVILGFEIKL